jgi:ferredoxin
MRIRLDADKCEGHGTCVDACPEIFQFEGDDDIVTVLDPAPSDAAIREKARRAVSVCPVLAIEVDE